MKRLKVLMAIGVNPVWFGFIILMEMSAVNPRGDDAFRDERGVATGDNHG